MIQGAVSPKAKLPYLTHDIESVSFAFRKELEDFEVEEKLAYEPCGEGEHTYLLIEKKKISTMEAMRAFKSYFRVSYQDMGFAGMKDVRAVARQTVSVPGAPDRIEEFKHPQIKILSYSQHQNKIKLGHVRSNSFKIKLRNFPENRFKDLEKIMDILVKRGCPNYFGEQRFGMRGDTWEVGRALLKKDYARAVEVIAGDPRECDEGKVLEARKLFSSGCYEKALKMWPRIFFQNIQMTKAMMRAKEDPKRAILQMDKKILVFYLNAFQSWIFNEALSKRVQGLDQIETGDVAFKHDNGASFDVKESDLEQERVKKFEISPSGPVLGYKMKEACFSVGEGEKRLFEEFEVKKEDFKLPGKLACRGERRPYRFKVSDVKFNYLKEEQSVVLEFRLPSGCYATAVLREIGKGCNSTKL